MHDTLPYRWPLALAASALLASAASLTPSVAFRALKWSPDFAAALQQAAEAKTVLFVAVHDGGTPDSEVFHHEHYRDATIGKLARASVLVYASPDVHGKGRCKLAGMKCSEHQACFERALVKVLNLQPKQYSGSPLHVFVGPDGKVISSITGRFREGQLEWAWVDAMRTVAPQFEWTLSNRAFAPRQLRYGFERPVGDKPPTAKEIADALAKLEKGGPGAWRDAIDLFPVVLQSGEENARNYASTFLASRWVRSDRRASILTRIGDSSPAVWGEVVVRWVNDREPITRWSAITALEKLAHPAATKPLLERWKSKDATDKELGIRHRILRALGPCGADDRKASRLLASVAKSDKDPTLRAAALIGAASLEDRKLFHKMIPAALADPAPEVRAAAAWAVGIRRDREMLEHVRVVAEAEKDGPAKALMQQVRTTIEKRGDAKPLETYLESLPGHERPPAPQERGGFGGGRR